MEIFTIKNLSFGYKGSVSKAIDTLTLSINEGDFVIVAGHSGCGKTTLLKMLKPQLTPVGNKSGDIQFFGEDILSCDEAKTCAEIGFVAQNPDSQIVTDKVWRELAFGLENIGEQNDVIMRKIGEMASYFGIEQLFHSSTAELSGGQKQLLNLASVMVMNPKVLLLDEPTAQLDPIASANFIATLQRVNRELGITIVIAEHHLEQLFSIADKVVIMQNGKVVAVDTPRAIASQLRERQGQADTQIDSLNAIGLPTCARVFTALYGEGDCPLTLQEGKAFLKKNFKNEIKSLQDKKVEIHCDCKQNCVELNSDDGGKVAELNKAVKKSKTVELNGGDSDKVAELNKVASERHAALEIKNCWFRYEKSAPDILRGLSLTLCQGEIFCLVGGNGVGKSTLLKVASGQVKSYQGKIKVFGKAIDSYKGGSLYRHGIAYLPQNVQEVFLKDNVAADFAEMVKTLDYANGAQYIKICLDALEVADLACRNPFDLSGGQQQKVALAKILLLQPKIILLDEPTKGIDAAAKLQLAQVVRKLASLNIAIVIVSHDIEFCAEVATKCALMFDGQIIASGQPFEFFENNNFYTTVASKLSRGYYEHCITDSDIVNICLANERIN